MKFYYIFFLLLFIPFVNAAIVDKPLVNISNCYNFSLNVDLRSGIDVPISFNGCSQTGSRTWFCNCYSSNNADYHLVMRTDDTILREKRDYRFTIEALVYDFKDDEINLRVEDWGDYIKFRSNTEHLGDDYEIIEIPVFINKTVYVDRLVNVSVPIYINNISERIVYVNQTQVVEIENVTKVKKLEESNYLIKLYAIIELIIISAVLITIIISLITRRKK